MTSRAILVTGGAGYIGSHACKALARAGYLPVAYDSLIHGHRDAVRWGPLVENDLANRAALVAAMREHDVCAVMHFAAFAYVGESMHEPRRYFTNNVVNALNLLDAMCEAGVRRIVFSSTCATYGMPDVIPITEVMRQLPVNPYGETKLILERALHWYGQAYGLATAILRYFNAAGADAAGEIGEDHTPETHLIPLVLDVAAGRRPHVDVYGTDYPSHDGTAVRDYIHVSDLADAHLLAIEYLLRTGQNLVLNLGTGVGYTVREVIETVGRITGCPIAWRAVARRPGDPAALIADPSRATRTLAWQPRRSDLETIVATAWTWHCRRHELATKLASGR